MTDKLTDSQKKDYVKNNGAQCPFCDDTDILGRNMEFEPGVINQYITCQHCDAGWWDVYKLIDAADDETP